MTDSTEPAASEAPPKPKTPWWGYAEATSSPETRAPYVACVSWPRSGHHLLVNLLRGSLGPRFGYCEFYVPSNRPGVPCCGRFPCVKRDVISMSKNHDFELQSPVPTDVPLLVQHRGFLPTLLSNYDLHIRNDNPDTEANFRSFATRTLAGYKAFRAKWLAPEMPNRFALDYETLTTDPRGSLRSLLDWLGIADVPERAVERAVAEAPPREGEPGQKGVRVTRDVDGFKFYDRDFFETLDRNAKDDRAPALPIIEAPRGPRRNVSPTRPLFVFVHVPRAAGMAMRLAFDQLLGRGNVFWHGRDGDVAELVREDKVDALKPFDLVGGEFSADLLPRVVAGRPVMLVAVVRNPMGRILSLFHVRRPGDTAIDAALEGEFGAEVRSAQCRLLAGTEDGDEATARIMARPHLVATHEHLQELVDRIAQMMGITRKIEVIQKDHSPAGYQAPFRNPETMALVRANVGGDLKLFQKLVSKGGISGRLPEEKP